MRWLCVFIWVSLPMSAFGQPLTVQTGEHANFTRVVVTIPADTTWQLGRNDAGYLLRVDGVNGYNIGGFYDLIPRDRIVDVENPAAGSDLQLFVDCLCYATAFLEGARVLVVDIRSGSPPNDAAFEQDLDFAPPRFATAPNTVIYRPPDEAIFPLLFTDEQPRVMPSSDAVVQPNTIVSMPAATVQSPVPAREGDLAIVEQSVAQSLARGLSQGLLDPERVNAQDDDALTVLQDILPPGVLARTGVDDAAIPPDPNINLTQQGQICPPDRFFAVAQWGDDRPFYQQMSVARGQITGEFDRIDEAAVLTQARLLIYFGFGREAVQTLNIDGKTSQERQYLSGIAKVIDGDAVGQNLFEQQVSCISDVALWALLSTRDGVLDGKVDPAAVLRTFKALPSWLQAHLGPQLSARFLAIGDEESALQALATAMAKPMPPVDAVLAETELLQSLGETEQASEVLKDLSRNDARATPEAMAAFLDAAVQEGFDVTAEDFLLADALRFQNALTPQGARLGIAQVRAYLAFDQFQNAQDLIAELSPGVAPDTYLEIALAHVSAVTQRGSPTEFLEMAFLDDLSPSPVQMVDAIAARLLSLGFPERAADIMNSQGNDLASPYLRAEAMLMLGNGSDALGILSDMESDRANALTQAAQAVVLGGTFDRDGYFLPDPENSAWQNEAWATLAQSEDDVMRDVSQEVLTQAQIGLDGVAPLAEGRMLLDQSEQSRDVVDRLLARFPIPAE